MVGRAIGRRDRPLREAIVLNLGWALLIALTFSLLFAVGGSRLIAHITDLPAVIAAANAQLPWLIAMPLLAVWCFLLDGVFIGATRAREMRNSMLVAALCGFFPVWWLCQGWGVAALWAAMAALMAGRGLTLGWLCWQLERDGRLLHSAHGVGTRSRLLLTSCACLSGRVHSCSELRSQLAPAFVDEHRHRIGEVHAAALGQHGNAQPLLERQALDDLHGQASALGPEQQGIAGANCTAEWAVRPWWYRRIPASVPRPPETPRSQPALDVGKLVVVEPGPLDPLVIPLKPQRLYQVQPVAGVGAEANDVAGVGGISGW
jgi:hypothetical protein